MQATMEAWNYSNFLCKNYTLNNLDNTLYNVYSLIRTIKELWKSLKRKKIIIQDRGCWLVIINRLLEEHRITCIMVSTYMSKT